MKAPPKNKSDMLSALVGNIPDEIIEANKTSPHAKASHKPSAEDLVRDSEEDYRFTRERVKKLAETSDEAISVMLNLASDSEHPRAFEVLANLIKTASDVNNQLITIQKDRKKILAEPTKKGEAPVVNSTTTNNVIFSGTTSDLQKFLIDRKKASEMIIDT